MIPLCGSDMKSPSAAVVINMETPPGPSQPLMRLQSFHLPGLSNPNSEQTKVQKMLGLWHLWQFDDFDDFEGVPGRIQAVAFVEDQLHPGPGKHQQFESTSRRKDSL